MNKIVSIDDPAELTRYIERWYHTRHREQLAWLAGLAAKVERVHAGHDQVPSELSTLLHTMIGEMEVHMKKEKLILFPAIRKGGGAGIEHPIAAMRADHDRHGAEISEILHRTGGLCAPEDACRSWSVLYDGLYEFVADLEEHIRLENDVLFPQFELSTH